MEIKDYEIKNVLDFYMLANNLKYCMSRNDKRSIADEIYGRMVLATAIDSEYKRTQNLGKFLREILLVRMKDYFSNEVDSCLRSTKNGVTYIAESNGVYKDEDFKFLFDCTLFEYSLSSFFDDYLVRENIQTKDILELYNIAKRQGEFDCFGDDDYKNYEIFKFYYLNRVLMETIRSGWDSKHWNISHKRIERISEHVVGSIALAIGMCSAFDFDVNLDKVIETLCIHEIGEIDIGDLTPFDGSTSEQKAAIEHEAWKKMLCNLTNYEDMFARLLEFDNKTTNDGTFVYYCDKLEADIQSKVYQDMGCHHPLTEQKNNIVFKSSKVQKILENGAKDAFDVWYQYDKPIYKDSEVFTKVLKYVKDNNLKRH